MLTEIDLFFEKMSVCYFNIILFAFFFLILFNVIVFVTGMLFDEHSLSLLTVSNIRVLIILLRIIRLQSMTL